MIRRTHKKSRSGCANCKRRRVKCDEQKPICSSCTNRGFDCTYISSNLVWMDKKAKSKCTANRDTRANSHGSSTPSREGSTHSENPTLDSLANAQPPNLNLEGLELVIHWFTSTAHTVAGNPAALQVVQTIILKQAMKHHFLLHGLLALSALHLAHSYSNSDQPDQIAEAKYKRIATAHHNQGLAAYHSILKDINDENSAASIAFSSITVIYSFALARPVEDIGERETRGMDLVDDLAQIFQLAKGWGKVVSVSNDLDGNSTRGHMNIENRNIDQSNVLPKDTEAAFERLHALSAQKSQDSERNVYNYAIETLKLTFVELASEEGAALNPHTALGWAGKLPDKFVNLLKTHSDLALVITSFYCVVLHRAPKVWWMSGWSTGLMRVLWQNATPGYQREMNWPREQVGLDCSTVAGPSKL